MHPYLWESNSEEDRAFARAVQPAIDDLAYDRLLDGIGPEGEPAALLHLGRLLRREAQAGREAPSASGTTAAASASSSASAESARSVGATAPAPPAVVGVPMA